MATITPQQLLNSWSREEEMTLEMAIGHVIQNLVELQRMLEATTIALYSLRSDVDRLIVHTQANLDLKGKTSQQRPLGGA